MDPPRVSKKGCHEARQVDAPAACWLATQVAHAQRDDSETDHRPEDLFPSEVRMGREPQQIGSQGNQS